MAGAPAINGAVLTSSDELSPLKARIPTVGSRVVMTDRSDARRMTVWVAAFADWPEDSAEVSAMRFASRLAVTFATWPAAYVRFWRIGPSVIRTTHYFVG